MKKKILIIEDDSSTRLLLAHILQDDYEISISNNGYEAMVSLEEGKIPDLIISDLSMPKMNGHDFIEMVKESGFFKTIPLIVLSATESSSERIKCLKQGASDYLVKPFNPEELMLRLENIFNSQKVQL